MRNIFNSYKSVSRLIIFIVFVITIVSGLYIHNLKFDYDFESFFPNDDPDLEFFLKHRQQFEYDNEFVLIGIENNKGIFQKDFLQKIKTFTDSVKTFHNITKVFSPANLRNTVVAPIGLIEVPYLHIDSSTLYKTDSINIYRSEELVGSFFAKDAKSVTVLLKTKEGISKRASDSLLFQIESLLQSFKFENVHIAGKLKAQYVYVKRLREEFTLFFIASFFLVVIFLLISFRSLWGIWMPMLVVLLSIEWILGFMAGIDKPLDVMMVLLPTMMFVVGMSDVVHVLTKYLEELRNGKEKMDAFRITIRDVAFPTFITLLSTAIGFLTLLYSSIKPIRDFGIYTSLGILVAFILSFTFLPAMILLRKKPILLKEEKNEDLFWSKNLHRLLLWIFKNKKWIVIGSVIVTVFSFVGSNRIVLNNNLLEDIVDSDSLKQDFYFFENHFSGVRPFEMAIVLKDTTRSIYDNEVLAELDKLETYLRTDYGVGFILSPVSVVKSMNKACNGGYPENYKLPSDTLQLSEVITTIRKYKRKSELKSLVSPDEHQCRIAGKMHDKGSMNVRELNAKLEEFYRTKLNTKLFDYKLTGTAVMIDKNNEYLVYNMLQGLFTSILVVSFIIALIYRSFKIVIISIIPNAIPILMMGGIMGYFGIELKMSTSIIFSIAFGIATDDTIHLLARMKLELDKGRSLLYAIKRTYISTGKAIVVTSLILSAGFLTLMLSSFQSTFYFGMLVSLILFMAVMVDLLLLPLLLLWMRKKC